MVKLMINRKRAGGLKNVIDCNLLFLLINSLNCKPMKCILIEEVNPLTRRASLSIVDSRVCGLGIGLHLAQALVDKPILFSRN